MSDGRVLHLVPKQPWHIKCQKCGVRIDEDDEILDCPHSLVLDVKRYIEREKAKDILCQAELAEAEAAVIAEDSDSARGWVLYATEGLAQARKDAKDRAADLGENRLKDDELELIITCMRCRVEIHLNFNRVSGCLNSGCSHAYDEPAFRHALTLEETR